MNVDLDNITVALSGEYVLIRERSRTVIFWHPWEGEAQFFNHGERPRPDKRSPELPEPPKGSYILLALAVFAGAVALALVFAIAALLIATPRDAKLAIGLGIIATGWSFTSWRLLQDWKERVEW